MPLIRRQRPRPKMLPCPARQPSACMPVWACAPALRAPHRVQQGAVVLAVQRLVHAVVGGAVDRRSSAAAGCPPVQRAPARCQLAVLCHQLPQTETSTSTVLVPGP